MTKRNARPTRVKVWWVKFWMRFSGIGLIGRLATRLAALASPPYKARRNLARLSIKGYVSPTARVHGERVELRDHIFIGDRVIISDVDDSGSVVVGTRSSLHQDCIVELGQGGNIVIGSHTHIQPRCQFSVYKGTIRIGDRVQIAPHCGFYPYDHGFLPGKSVADQDLKTRGGIEIADDVWIGFGVIVLDGVHIGEGAVIGAGSVVKSDIPSGAIAVGSPARVVKMRSELGDARNE
jgi:acetyltransferase-like isoleucine patch superfamily enzyme